VLSNFEDASHRRKVWQLIGAVRNEPVLGEEGMSAATRHISAQFDELGFALLDGLEPLYYERSTIELPAHVRAGSALRCFYNRLVIVQDDVNALAVRDVGGIVHAVLLPPNPAGQRVFDDTLGNKSEKLDLEAAVVLPNTLFVAFGSGSSPARERIVVWDHGEAANVIAAPELYREVRAAVTRDGGRLNIEGAVVRGSSLELLHRANDKRGSGANAIAEIDCEEFAGWLAGKKLPRVTRVTTVDLGTIDGVPFGFTDAVALDDERVVIVACAEDSTSAISDGAVLGCRVGMLANGALTMVDVHDAGGARSKLKLEGIERRSGSSTEFDVVVDVDEPSVAAQIGRLVWDRR